MNDKMWVTFSFTTYVTNTYPPQIGGYEKRHMQIPSAVYLALIQGGRNAIFNYIESNIKYDFHGLYELDYSTSPTMRIAELERSGNELQKNDIRNDMDKARISPRNQRCVEVFPSGNRDWISTDAFESPIKELRKYNTGLVTVLLNNGKEYECPFASSH